MRVRSDIPWTRIGAELAAIVGGILLAFWIQAWWENRQDSRDEQVVLAALRDEFQAKKDLLTMRREFHTRLLESTRTLIRASLSEDAMLTPADVDRHLGTLWWYNTQDEWVSATLDALYEGGNLTIISDPELRVDLAKWPALFGALNQRVNRDEEYFKSVLLPFLTKNAHLPQIYLHLPDMPASPETTLREPGWEIKEPVDNSAILKNPEFANILTEKVDRHLAILDIGFKGLDERLDDTIALIDAALSK